ncbi:MAG: RecQ family ATP-dependent DNA helicase [Aristaeellaceae bacterium]
MLNKEKARRIQALQVIFGLQGFRPGQEKAVDTLLLGRDLICMLPTGAGKSLCWQLPAVLHDGWTLVVSPLIALMRDQLRAMTAHGLDTVCLDSLQTPEEREETLIRIAGGKVRVVLVSPERLQSARFCQTVQGYPPWLMVVDEAHCILRWGKDFRPAYAQMGSFIAALPTRPVLCALTATADAAMRREIAQNLDMHRPKNVVMPVTRENLHLSVCTTIRPEETLLRLMRRHAHQKCVIFCRMRRDTERIAHYLCRAGLSAAYYHAGMDRAERLEVQRRFTEGETTILAATTAFGMGVDVPDIRCIVLHGLPDTMLDLAQQFGRAGRDGAEAECVLLFDPAALDRRCKHLRKCRRESGRGLRGWCVWHKACKDVKALLDWCLSGRCLQQGLARAFGQKSKRCGLCSACQRAERLGRCKRLAATPEIHHMYPQHLRAWAMRWERAEMARQSGQFRQSVMDERTLLRAARTGRMPEKTRMSDQDCQRMEALLKHMTDRNA